MQINQYNQKIFVYLVITRKIFNGFPSYSNVSTYKQRHITRYVSKRIKFDTENLVFNNNSIEVCA